MSILENPEISREINTVINLLNYQLGNAKFNLGYSEAHLRNNSEAEKFFTESLRKSRETGNMNKLNH